MKEKSSSIYVAPALGKGLDILEALSLATVPQTLADLARSCKRTPSQLFRMIHALEKRSYIVRDPVSGGYELTLKLYHLAHTHSPVDHLLKAAQLPMRNLANTLHESCHLSVLSDDRLLVIAEQQSPDPVRLSVEVGYCASPLNTASGNTLVAFMEPGAQKQFLDRDPAFLGWKPAQRKALRLELGRIRDQRFCLAQSSVRTGVDVSCFVGSARLGLIAALGVPFIAGGRNDGRERQLVPVIERHAGLITKALGLDVERDLQSGGGEREISTQSKKPGTKSSRADGPHP